MDSTVDKDGAKTLSDAIVAFALDGRFPESDDVSSISLSKVDLGPAIDALGRTREELETEIRQITEETDTECSAWVSTARSLRDDLLRTKTLANEIIVESETPDGSGKAIQEAEGKVDFLEKEVVYTEQLLGALDSIRHVNDLLSQVEAARSERRILDSLHLLEKSWAAMDALPVGRTCRAVKLLDVRSFELKSDVHEVFDHVWKALVNVDIDTNTIVIYTSREDEQMNLDDAVVGLKAYKEVEERMEQLWHNLDAAIVDPRLKMDSSTFPSVRAETNSLSLFGQTDSSVEALLRDLETIFTFLAQKLPKDLLEVLCTVMMGDVTARLVKGWLDSSIPPALQEVDQFESVIEKARRFCQVLEQHGYSGWGHLKDWVDNAPAMWLAKCREIALDGVRKKLSSGIGASVPVEKIERQMVSMAEAKNLANTSGAVAAAADNDDWDADWGHDAEENGTVQEAAQAETAMDCGNEDDGGDAWGWGDGEEEKKPLEKTSDTEMAEGKAAAAEEEEEEEEGDAWGWGEQEATTDNPPVPKPKTPKSPATQPAVTREMVLKETYHISSMPEPVLSLISSVLEDGAFLTQAGDSNPVAAAAAGLFGIPTLALALFRGISPYYYSLDMGGNMFLYNDATYLAERLSEFTTEWKARDDLSARARNMVRLDNDVKTLRSFAKRAYTSEINTQKLVLRDLLGGAESLMQQDEIESCVDSAVARVGSMAVVWENILGRSVWNQAVGALADTISSKVIADVMEMSSIGQDEAYSTAKTIAKITELDDFFRPSRAAGKPKEAGEIAATAQYVPTWLRLQFLSEVLQSNLNEVRYLWFESELSLHFTADEVVELVNMSFEANARTKDVIRGIMQKPHPVEA